MNEMITLILGITLSGKTLLAKELSKTLSEQGKRVLIFNPMDGKGYTGETFSDKEVFIEEVNKSPGAILIIDEVTHFFSSEELVTFAEENPVILIGQQTRASLDRLIYDADILFLFHLPREDGKVLSTNSHGVCTDKYKPLECSYHREGLFPIKTTISAQNGIEDENILADFMKCFKPKEFPKVKLDLPKWSLEELEKGWKHLNSRPN